MSDQPGGPDWWQASDGKWYPEPPEPEPVPPPPDPSGHEAFLPTVWHWVGGWPLGLKIGVAGLVMLNLLRLF